MNKKVLEIWTIIITILCICSVDLYAQDSLANFQFFKQRNYGKYFVADINAPITNLSVGYWTNSIEYNLNNGRNNKTLIPATELNLGTEIPLLNWSKGKHKIAVLFPFSFKVWLDLFEDVTAPVLNTDYQAGMELNYLYHINRNFIKNLGVKFIPVLHESTHIGDEITIYRINRNFPITRVNVSYEVTEIALQLNDPMNENRENLSFKLGTKYLLNPNKGWYFATKEDADTLKIADSKRWIEPYFQIQYQKTKGFLATQNLMFVLSTDFRMRIKFGYPYYTINNNNVIENSNNEEYSPSVNFLLGWKYKNADSSLSRIGFYLRTYYGINYHGQFRNQDQFKFMGISIIYEN